MTRQNSSRVDERAAAAESLKVPAGQLATAIAPFKLSGAAMLA